MEKKIVQDVGGNPRTIFVKADDVVGMKNKLAASHIIPTMWQLKDTYEKNGWIGKGMALSFFCPIYFAGQTVVKALLGKRDEHDELMLFPLPAISDPRRIKVGLEHMKKLKIKNPEKYLVTDKNDKKKTTLPIYSSLNGIEGIGSDHSYGFIGYEAVQLGCFMVVPKGQLNAGDPYNQTYRFPSEAGYSPFWRIPEWEEFKKMRPDLGKLFKKTDEGIIKVKFPKM